MGIDIKAYIRGALSPEIHERVHNAVQSIGGDGIAFRAAHGEDPALTFCTSWRSYYGPGYERGPWPVISAVLDILRAVAPDGEVYYHGDSSWYFELPPFTREDQDAVWRHWAGPHWDDYHARGDA